MSNRSLARKNRNHRRRSNGFVHRVNKWLGLVETTAILINQGESPNTTADDRLHADICSGKEINHSFDMGVVYDHQGHVPITIEQKEPLLCYTKTPSRLEAIGRDYNGSMDPCHVPIFHMPTQEEMDNVWEDGILTLGRIGSFQHDLDKACGDGTKLK